MKSDSLYLNKLRHTCEHVMNQAIEELWPGKVARAIGPVIDDGFYMDARLDALTIKEEDFKKIEKRMQEIVDANLPVTRKEFTEKESRILFKENPFKQELIDEIVKSGEKITIYITGDNQFVDLCKGPHVQKTGEIKAFKLLSLAGAYWRGDEKREMLTRIYGTAFESKGELEQFLHLQEEAKRRDHKKLGKELGLFVFSDLVGAGLPLFTPRGNHIKEKLEQYITEEKKKRGYTFVHIPHIANAKLYEKSGHLGKYDAMMPKMVDDEGSEYVIKPMNCPHHFELYNAKPHSYRDLPLRYAENTTVYRNEKSGELSGLVRVKSLTQDDTHHFVRHDQIESEIKMILGLMKQVYQTFGLINYVINISVRDPHNPQKYFGDDPLWQRAESILIKTVKEWGAPYRIAKGEAAFYGPKIDITVSDSLGRPWQLTTVQLDFNQPENFDMTYTGADGKKHRPAVLHVAVLGAVERFMGILIEHFGGAFPLWLAPAQIILIPVSSQHVESCQELKTAMNEHAEKMRKEKLYIEIDEDAETVGYKIRHAATQKIPYTIVIGEQEIPENGKWTSDAALVIRKFGEKETIQMKLGAFLKTIELEIKDKS